MLGQNYRTKQMLVGKALKPQDSFGKFDNFFMLGQNYRTKQMLVGKALKPQDSFGKFNNFFS